MMAPMRAGTGPMDATTALTEAAARSDGAARQAGVAIRELDTMAGATRAAELFCEVWQGGEVMPVPANMLRTVQHAGGYVFGAFDERGRLVGATMAFLAAQGLHSHITGVLASTQRGGVGLALKLHQRTWALSHGITAITWTCDPLVRRNVAFNLHALGASVTDYLIDHYGQMPDGVNAGDESDRLELRWDLLGPVDPPPRPEPGDRPRAVATDHARRPVLADVTGPARLVALPADIEILRQEDPAAAAAWRHAVREAIEPALAAGASVIGLTQDGDLVVDVPTGPIDRGRTAPSGARAAER